MFKSGCAKIKAGIMLGVAVVGALPPGIRPAGVNPVCPAIDFPVEPPNHDGMARASTNRNERARVQVVRAEGGSPPLPGTLVGLARFGATTRRLPAEGVA